MSLNDSTFRDKKIERMLNEISQELGISITDVRQVVRTYYSTIYKTITETKFIDTTNNTIMVDSFYLLSPHLFSFQMSKRKVNKINKLLKDKHDKESV